MGKPVMKLNPPDPSILDCLNGVGRILNEHDITFNQAALLSALPASDTHPNNGITPSDVAELMGITRGGVTRLCRVLLTRKLITHERTPADWRYVVLRRTKKGDVLMARLTLAAEIAQAKPEEMFV